LSERSLECTLNIQIISHTVAVCFSGYCSAFAAVVG